MAADNVSLGSFNLTGLPPAPRGIPQIEVKFDIDANGILNVTAKDLGTKKEAKITIQAGSKLSKDDEDKKKKETVDLKNEAESFVYTAEKLLTQDLKDKLTQEQGIKISEAIKELKEVLDKDSEQIRPKLDALKTIVNQISTELYKNAAPPPNTEEQQSQSGSSDQNTQGGTADQKTQGTGTTS
jgi:molecular chaperone DnaK